MEQPSARDPAEGPSLHAAYEADSSTRCRRGATVYDLLAIAIILATEVLDQGRFPLLAGSLWRIRLVAVAALAVVLLLLQSPLGRRHPRPFGLLGPSIVGFLQSSLALATGGPMSPVNISTTFAILGVA